VAWYDIFRRKQEEEGPVDRTPARQPTYDERSNELGFDQWLSYFSFDGNEYPVQGNFDPEGATEGIPNDFVGYISSYYKASGAIFAVALTRMLIFSEARFVLQSIDPQSDLPGDFIPDKYKTLQVLKKPWPNGTSGELLARAIQDVDFGGNFYAVREKVKGRDGVPTGKERIRRLRPDWVTIVLTADPKYASRSDVHSYVYKPGGTRNEELWEVFPVDGTNGAVVHWSPIPDPAAQYRGMSWLTPIMRELQADKEITAHKEKFFKGGAAPRYAVSMDETVSFEEYQKFKKVMEAKLGSKNPYDPVFLGGGAEVSTIGTNVQQLDFATVTGIGELRICAAGRVHPAIVGLSEGVKGSSLNAGNFEAARNNFATGTMKPLWRSFCAALEPLLDIPDGARLWFDDKDIDFLREDHEKVARRQQIQATTLSRLVMQGFTWDSAVEAMIKDDWSLLDHTGLFSVQLLPPGVFAASGEAAPAADTKGGKSKDGKKTGTANSKANNTPTGSKRKPVGRPPNPEAKSDENWLDAIRDGEDWTDEEEKE
jgi:phage portal protein BeeE